MKKIINKILKEKLKDRPNFNVIRKLQQKLDEKKDRRVPGKEKKADSLGEDSV